MIRLTRNKILFVFVVMLLTGITSLLLLSSKTEKYSGEQVRFPSPVELKVSSHKNTVPTLGADDAQWQKFMDNPDADVSSADILEVSDVSVSTRIKDELAEVELIAAWQHPDYPPPPRREDFSSEVDYLIDYLEFYQKQLARAEGTKYQSTFESTVATIKDDIAREKARIAREEELRQEPSWEEVRATLMKENAWVAGLNALSEEEQKIYVRYIEPSIQSTGELEFSDDVLDSMLSDFTVYKAFGLEPTESVSVPIPTEPKSPIGHRTFPQEIGSVHDELLRKYPDQFTYRDKKSRDVLSQILPSDAARQSFAEREVALQQEYADLLQARVKEMPKEKQRQAIGIVRRSLSQKWDRDFADSVMRQLNADTKE